MTLLSIKSDRLYLSIFSVHTELLEKLHHTLKSVLFDIRTSQPFSAADHLGFEYSIKQSFSAVIYYFVNVG